MRKKFVFVIVKDEKEKKAVDKMIQIESESQQKALLKKLSKKSSKSPRFMNAEQRAAAEWFETYIRPLQIERAERLKREKREEERRKKRKKKNKR